MGSLVLGSQPAAKKYPALLRGVDVAELLGEPIFQRGGVDVIVTPAAQTFSGGRFPDVLGFLHGYGSQTGRSMTEELRSSWVTAGGSPGDSWEVIITGDDRVAVRVPTVDLASFDLAASSGNAWGFATGTTNSSTVGTYQQVTAPDAWKRGNVDLYVAPNAITITDGVTACALSTTTARVQAIPTALRASTDSEDGLGPVSSLERLDNFYADSPDFRIRWGVDAAGKVWTSYPSSVSAITWLATDAGLAFRRFFGFTGEETVSTVLGRSILTATYPCPAVLVLYRGMSRYQVSTESIDGAVTLANGRARGRHIGASTLHDVTYTLRGPTSQLDQEGQAVRAFWPASGRGQPLTLWLDIGDPRRHRHVEQLYSGEAVPEFSTAYTTQHLKGRIVGRVAASSSSTSTFGLDGARVRSSDVSVTIAEEP
jgi:hypothetical protein